MGPIGESKKRKKNNPGVGRNNLGWRIETRLGLKPREIKLGKEWMK